MEYLTGPLGGMLMALLGIAAIAAVPCAAVFIIRSIAKKQFPLHMFLWKLFLPALFALAAHGVMLSRSIADAEVQSCLSKQAQALLAESARLQ